MENGSVQTWKEPHKEYRLKENLRFAIQPNGVIRVHDVTYERNGEGLQIVLLDKEKGYVVDHSVFGPDGIRIQ